MITNALPPFYGSQCITILYTSGRVFHVQTNYCIRTSLDHYEIYRACHKLKLYAW